MLKQAEYLWLDGSVPTQQLRSKTRIVEIPEDGGVDLSLFPQWSYDGSSTNQADGSDSDLLLEPVNFVRDPIRGEGNYLVMCEVLRSDGTPHSTNTRAALRFVLEQGAAAQDPWIGFEQEYTLLRPNGTPFGFPENGFPSPQGPYYCGVGANVAIGRELVEAHTAACLEAGIMVYGINAEVMPGQWEFQIGYRGRASESADPLNVSDHLWFARWLLARLGEDHGIQASFDAKPVKGDWNGAGAHTNFSTKAMRDSSGIEAIHDAIGRLEAHHDVHVANYGAHLEERLTGLHETCAIHEFRAGVADRGASIRIPRQVEERGYGYLEDRRPGANCDPYVVSTLLLRTVCGVGDTTSLALAS